MNTSPEECPPEGKPLASCCDELGELIPMEWVRRPWYVRLVIGLIGVVFIALGILGWLIPVIPGFFLVPVGVILIAASSAWVARHVNAYEGRLSPRTRRAIHHPVHWVEARLPARCRRYFVRRPRRKRRLKKEPVESSQ